MAERYDLVVVGDTPGAVATAALVARRCRRVLLALPADRHEARLVWTGHVAEAPHVRRVLQALSLSDSVRETGDSGGCAVRLQLLSTAVRVDVPRAPERVLPALQHAFAADAAALAAWHVRLQTAMAAMDQYLSGQAVFPGDGLFALRPPWPLPAALRPYATPATALALDQLFAGMPNGGCLRSLLLWPALDALPEATWSNAPNPPSVLALIRALWHAYFAPAARPTQQQQWCAHLLEAAVRSGVKVVRGVQATSLAAQGRRANAVQLRAPGAEQVQAAWFVADVKRERWQACGEVAATPGGHAAPAPTNGRRSWHPWRLQLHAGWLPAPLGPRSWLIDDVTALGRWPWRGDADAVSTLGDGRGPVRLSRPKGCHQGQETLHLELYADAEAGTDVDVVRRRLRRAFPRLSGGVVDMQPHPTGEALGARRAFTQPRAGAVHRLLGQVRRTRLRNVLHCGADVLPEMGLEGEFTQAVALEALLFARAGWC